MIVVHHLNNSRSQRILWMLEELGLPYEVKLYERDAETMLAPAALSAVHRLGKSPVLSDGDKVLAESGAILEYLAEAYGNGKFVPAPGTPDRLHYTYFMHYAEGSLMPLLLMKLVFTRLPQRAPMLMKPAAKALAAGADTALIAPQLKNHLGFLERELSGRDWFAGSAFSAADIQMSFPLEAAAARAGLATDYPKLSAFLHRIHARPAYKRAIDRGGPYALLR